MPVVEKKAGKHLIGVTGQMGHEKVEAIARTGGSIISVHNVAELTRAHFED